MKNIFTAMLLWLTLSSSAQNSNPCSCTDCRCADSLELVKLYNAADGANWTNEWDLTQPMNTWYLAIPMLENGRVTYIDLQQNGLNGTIPNLHLPKLKELFLSDYNLTGSLPNFNLPALEILFITNSQVSGTLPDFNLPNLQSLAVSGCPFITGTIPAFNNMPNLRQLALSGNQLSGTIPNFTQSLTLLQLGGNLLSGTIPNFSMPNLTTVELDGNQLTGSLPNFNLPKLQYLSLGGNQLTGAIPELHLPALVSLNAAYNQLSGALPSFNYLPLLNVLDLSNNQLSGAAPAFAAKSPLYTISFANNQLTGSIPAYNLSLLVNLSLGNNQLTGTIPSFQLPKLQGLLLNHNQLSGAIPNFNLPDLTALGLDSNQLTGAIPNFNFPQLQFLHLNSNQLSGSIPPFNLPYLQSLLLNNNQLTGCIPGAIKTNSPLLQHEGDISNNPGLATQSWSDYWDNNAGVCQPPPTASVLTADQSSVCSGSSTALRVNITGGNSPYTVVYSIGKAPNNTRFTITNYTSGAAITVSPTANTTYDLVSVTDATFNAGTGNSGAPTITVTQPTTWYLDADRDKYYISSVLSCTSPGPGYSDRGSPVPGDCNDNNAAVHPNATEVCDGIDNNCDGQVDEGFPMVNYYRDADGDGYGNPNDIFAAKCSAPAGYISTGGDCNDGDQTVHPGATEICDGIDNNCDGQVDEGFPLINYYRDADGDGYGNPNDVFAAKCSAPAGYISTSGDCDDNNAYIHSGAVDVCDGIDNDCDGQIDEDGPLVTYYFDTDGDGYGDPNNPVQARCYTPQNTVTNNQDCNDHNAAIHPGAVEICGNGIDDNCNGQIDEGSASITYYKDADGDGYGNPKIKKTANCTPPAGYVANNGDCNDNNAAVHPGATEICDGIDNDCDGKIDEDFPYLTYYRDADGDGYGDPKMAKSGKCTVPAGYVSNNKDCNDNNATIYPGATEICDGIDNDCDGKIDEDFPYLTYYRDADGDGYGNPKMAKSGKCTVPAGYVSNNKDCNDNNAAIHPGATEICDGIDNNCDGKIDEDFPYLTYYRDADGDGYGDPKMAKSGKCTIPAGYVSNNKDCNDNNAAVHLGATEICGNGIDDNCNGKTDEGCANVSGNSAIVLARPAQTPPEAEKMVKVFPNPAQSKVYISLTGYAGRTTIQLQSVDGKILRQEKLNASLKFAQQSLDIARFTNGVYLVLVIDEKGNRETKKLVIVH